MNYWIEVSSEYRFKQKLARKQGLYAPSNKRYMNMLKNVKTGDLVFHYIVQIGASKKNGSAIIGISSVSSEPRFLPSRISVAKSINDQTS